MKLPPTTVMEPSNLVEGLHELMDRARELQQIYEGIPTGFIGASVIDMAIKQAEHSIETGDVVEMLAAYGKLEALE